MTRRGGPLAVRPAPLLDAGAGRVAARSRHHCLNVSCANGGIFRSGAIPATRLPIAADGQRWVSMLASLWHAPPAPPPSESARASMPGADGGDALSCG